MKWKGCERKLVAAYFKTSLLKPAAGIEKYARYSKGPFSGRGNFNSRLSVIVRAVRMRQVKEIHCH
jgi:hypothetical protein